MLQLPPLNALRAFEVAARHLSFKRAAEELCVTQSAVSRHILNLEDFLGTKLFQRRHRQVVLTREGSVYLQAVREALIGIANATSALAAARDQRMLKLKMPPTCAIRWLVPRLARFHDRHPEVSVQLTTSHDPVNFDRDDVDVAVQYGRRVQRGLEGERLFGEVLVPVVSPKPAVEMPRLDGPADLSPQVLLHSIQRPEDWPRWFAAAGLPAPAVDQGLIFQNSSLTYQGAVDGLGVAMAQLAFVIDELKSGRLTEPFDLRLHHEDAYFFVVPRDRGRLQRVRDFRAWIAEEAAQTRAAGGDAAL